MIIWHKWYLCLEKCTLRFINNYFSRTLDWWSMRLHTAWCILPHNKQAVVPEKVWGRGCKRARDQYNIDCQFWELCCSSTQSGWVDRKNIDNVKCNYGVRIIVVFVGQCNYIHLNQCLWNAIITPHEHWFTS